MSPTIEAYSQPVSEEMPCGENLEYDPLFQEMESLFEPPKGSMVEGKKDEDEEPNWKGVEKCAAKLLENTRDLRVLVYAAIASLHTRGLEAFRDHLKLLNIYLEDFWDTLHPNLDPEDNNDPMVRSNTLEILNDYGKITLALKGVKLVELQGMGRYGVREVELAKGEDTPREGEEVPDLNAIQQAFIRADQEEVGALRAAAGDSIALLGELGNIWYQKTDGQPGPSFDNAISGLKEISSVFDEFVPSEVVGEDAAAEGEAGGGGPVISGAVRSRADVVRVLDNICEYYAVNEPSSPVPLLLRRAQRLVEKSFMEILEDMVPDGVQQARMVGGNTDENA